ncbi:Proline--tRNA ligase 2 [Candidatus Desulfarcum epimagneticum]|uniref:Proline--tRNA ligase n=1 Tax=uncultured Desulfobacteraceae bacterium TaxID=218296 RepID=A0A484HJZ8_9BACT|nr:Proline--tRNA ligase 2 [uncultured Desulfobacteraceae bacterium]
MGKKAKHAVSPARDENYAEWYQQAVVASDLAERSSVRGCMVIKPWGYALWENIVRELDDMFKETGVKNAYFPLFIPLNFLQKEADHVEGFATECAVVTHHRLEKDDDGDLVPAGPLQEPLVVRPTSETIIGDSFSRWISSYRDLPLLVNQWANVVRWEMRTRIFLRTSEFLWQEGHTAHADEKEAVERTRLMLEVYRRLAEDFLAMPVVTGFKTSMERFPGAVDTLCIEAMMQDRKALQAGTSHFLGQNFAKASGIAYQSAQETEEFAWTTSWGVSTRLIGGVIMTHGDDDGIILPPRVASSHVVLMPIIRKPEEKEAVMAFTEGVAAELRALRYHGRKVRVEIDDRDIGGARGWDWIKKGVPVRVEIGPRDMKEDSVFMARRDRGHRDRQSVPRKRFVEELPQILDDIQKTLFERASSFMESHTRAISEKKKFEAFFTPENSKNPEIHGGFALSPWCGSDECEAAVKAGLGVTIRCVPFDGEKTGGRCVFCGKEGLKQALFAKSY